MPTTTSPAVQPDSDGLQFTTEDRDYSSATLYDSSKKLTDMATQSLRSPSFDKVVQVCLLSRTAWRKAVQHWLINTEEATREISDLLAALEQAKLALEDYCSRPNSVFEQSKSASFLRNIKWRIEMARILSNADETTDRRFQKVCELQSNGPSEPQGN